MADVKISSCDLCDAIALPGRDKLQGVLINLDTEEGGMRGDEAVAFLCAKCAAPIKSMHSAIKERRKNSLERLNNIVRDCDLYRRNVTPQRDGVK